MDASRQQAQEFEARYKGTIASADLTATHLLQALQAYESLLAAQYRPQSYAQLHYSTDTVDAARGALLQSTREFGSQVSTHLVFFDLELGQIPPAVYDQVASDPLLASYRHYLDHERQMAAHNLSEPEERVLVETANSRGRAFARLATEVNSRTRYHIELDGTSREGTGFVERYMRLLSSGCASAPAQLVSELGLDISDRDFWQGGCDLIAERVAQAEQLAAAAGTV